MDQSINQSIYIIICILLVSGLQTKFQDKHVANKITARATWLYIYKKFLSKCQGKMEKEDGKYPSWHGSIYPTAKGRTEAETDLCANSVNPEAGTFHSNFPHEWLRQIMYSTFLFLPSLTSEVRQNGLKFWSASQASRKKELILWNNTRIPGFKAPIFLLDLEIEVKIYAEKKSQTYPCKVHKNLRSKWFLSKSILIFEGSSLWKNFSKDCRRITGQCNCLAINEYLP